MCVELSLMQEFIEEKKVNIVHFRYHRTENLTVSAAAERTRRGLPRHASAIIETPCKHFIDFV